MSNEFDKAIAAGNVEPLRFGDGNKEVLADLAALREFAQSIRSTRDSDLCHTYVVLKMREYGLLDGTGNPTRRLRT